MTGLAAERLVLLFVGLTHDLDDLAVDLVEVRILTVDGRPCVQTVQSLRDTGERGVSGLEEVPLLKLDGVLLVHELGVLEQLVPVVLDVVFLLDEGDSVLEYLGGVGMCARLVVDHGESYGEVRQIYTAALEHGGTLGGVAGHIRGKEGLAEDGECVVNGNAGLSRAAGADVGRQTVGLGDVYVVGVKMLVNVADDELRQSLERDGDKILEALHKQRRKNLVHRNHEVAQRAAAETLIVCEDESNLTGQAANYGVHIQVSYLQLVAAEALEQTVDEHEGAEVGAHPAVFPEALEAGDGSGGDHLCHGEEVIQPCDVVDHGVLHAAPLTPFRNAGLVVVTAALAAYAVLGLPDGVEALKLFINRSNYFVSNLHLICLPEWT